MRVHVVFAAFAASLCATVLVGCAVDTASASRPSGALPAQAAADNHGAIAAVRKPAGAGNCVPGMPLTSGIFAGGGSAIYSEAPYSAILGGYGNSVCGAYASVSGGNTNLIGQDGEYGFIGGGNTNQVFGEYEFIGAGNQNSANSSGASVVGGYANQDDGTNGFLGGGESNEIPSPTTDAVLGGGSGNYLSATYGVIVGGIKNTVSGEGGYIAAGGYNTVSGEGAVIDGGFNSTASGTFATIPGGYVNSAAGTYSFAAGARASAAQEGTFVWSDGSDGDTILTSSRAYQFLARASGGFTLYTNAASTVGAQLAAGSGTWASLSDRNVKTNIAPLDDAAVLDKVASLPISRWSYKSEHGVRHVGPMAQDFYAAFGVGEDDKHITSIDEDGVALAAIKALHAENADAHAAMKALHAENASLRAQLAALKTSQSRHDLLVDRELQRLSAVVSVSRER
jgi:hypothetical protein